VSASDLVSELRARLEAERRRLDDEIRHYPTPIPRCDAQFNHLFDQRARIVAAIDALAALETVEL
jgi:hypothetical protein